MIKSGPDKFLFNLWDGNKAKVSLGIIAFGNHCAQQVKKLTDTRANDAMYVLYIL